MITMLLGTSAVSAAALMLPHDHYGNEDGCAYLASGTVEDDGLQYLTRRDLATFGSGCSFTNVAADASGNQRAEGICSHEGESYLTAEDHIISRPDDSGRISIYTATGEIWGELEPCL